MMKPGTKLLFIALSCLTLASGCTKKKSNNSSKAPDKVEAKTDVTGPVKTDPKPTPPKADEGAETPSPSGVTPAPAADPTKATPPKSETPTASTTPQTTVTPKPEQASSDKSDIEKYEDCVVPTVANLLGIERAKNAEVIEAKNLFETKLAVLKSCQKPASVAPDFAESMVTKKIIDFAEVKFIDAEGFVEAFYEIERQQLPESERRKIYDQISAEAKAIANPAATPAPKAAPTTNPTPTPVGQPAPTTVVPQTVTVPTPPNVTNTPPTATAKPQATAPAQQHATPVKAAAAPVGGAKAKEQAAKDVKKESQLVIDFKKCFSEMVTPGIAGFKTDKIEIISPRDLYELKLSALSLCDFESAKEPKLDDYMTSFMVTILNKEYPKSKATIKMFVDTEKQTLAVDAKRAVYDKLAKEAKVESTFAKPAVAKASATEVKDIASLTKCLDIKIESLIMAEKAKKKEIEHPIELLSLEKTLIQNCKIIETAEVKTVRIKAIEQKVTTHYPNAKDKLVYFMSVDKLTNNDQLKVKLFQLYNFYLEIQEKNSLARGVLEPSLTSGNVIAYTIKSFGGETLNKIQAPGKPLATNKGESDNIQPEGLYYIFDFTQKENKTSTLTVKLNESVVVTLDFTLTQGTLSDLKAKKPVVIALTAQSWKKIWELRWRQQLMITPQEAAKFPLKFNMESAKGTRPLCELKATEIACSDPDLVTKMKVNTEALILH